MKPCAKCGLPIEPERIKQRYCRQCHLEYMKAWRAGEVARARNETSADGEKTVIPVHFSPPRTRSSFGPKYKENARAYAGVYKRRGTLVQQSCAKCGNPDTEMHHHDYSKPLDVVWLCRKCHRKGHTVEAEIKRMDWSKAESAELVEPCTCERCKREAMASRATS